LNNQEENRELNNKDRNLRREFNSPKDRNSLRLNNRGGKLSPRENLNVGSQKNRTERTMTKDNQSIELFFLPIWMMFIVCVMAVFKK
jgi:hypothetical protein